jgi:hypothetical protein
MKCYISTPTLNNKPSLRFQQLVSDLGQENAEQEYFSYLNTDFKESFGYWDIYSKTLENLQLTPSELETFTSEYGNNQDLIDEVFSGSTNEMGEPTTKEVELRNYNIVRNQRRKLIESFNTEIDPSTDELVKRTEMIQKIDPQQFELEELYHLNTLEGKDKIDYLVYSSLDQLEEVFKDQEVVKQIKHLGYSLKDVLTNKNIENDLVKRPGTNEKFTNLFSEFRNLVKTTYKLSSPETARLIEDLRSVKKPALPLFLKRAMEKITPEQVYNAVVNEIPSHLVKQHTKLVNNNKFKIIC